MNREAEPEKAAETAEARQALQPATPGELVEGEDYYMDGPAFVFTAAYHSKRGYCCNSRCRHCPYDKDEEPTTVRDPG